MKRGNAAALAAVVVLVAACGQKPIKPAATHIRGDEPRAEGTIPPPVQLTPVLPQPKPAARPDELVLRAVGAQLVGGPGS